MLNFFLLFGCEGDGLSMDVFEILVKVVLIVDEKKKFMNYDGSFLNFGFLDCFFYVILYVLNVFFCFSVLLYWVKYEEEMWYVWGVIKVLEVIIWFFFLFWFFCVVDGVDIELVYW